MKKIFCTILAILLLQNFAFAQEKGIEELRRIVKGTDDLITKANRNFAKEKTYGDTGVFLTVMEINKKETSYPAVGTYRKVIKFYYTYGDRGENPYPNRLLKISVLTYRAGWVSNSEFYYDEKESLVFYFNAPQMETMDASDESRMYFTDGKLTRFLVGKDDITNTNFRRKAAIVQEVLDEQENLKRIFKLSIKE